MVFLYSFSINRFPWIDLTQKQVMNLRVKTVELDLFMRIFVELLAHWIFLLLASIRSTFTLSHIHTALYSTPLNSFYRSHTHHLIGWPFQTGSQQPFKLLCPQLCSWHDHVRDICFHWDRTEPWTDFGSENVLSSLIGWRHHLKLWPRFSSQNSASLFSIHSSRFLGRSF